MNSECLPFCVQQSNFEFPFLSVISKVITTSNDVFTKGVTSRKYEFTRSIKIKKPNPSLFLERN